MIAGIQLVYNLFKIQNKFEDLPNNIQQVGTEEKRSKGVIIAVLDTGCSIHHHDQ
ncbi:hypothetical protein ABID52_000610 [Fictibacillus halophilus]|uniref:Peptidase S8/S53 domain-containing protein n=1 Tax=Fictibacillus halophilus TaxID=1610490 RepID=A0ABV2LG14_9BACL|nr:hypothetical protein [Fictibacillus halophilus]